MNKAEMESLCKLKNCLTMGAELNTPDFLLWIADRLVNVYKEDPNIDFVLSLKERAYEMKRTLYYMQKNNICQ